MGDKHYVYSARTTKDGLAVLSKAKGDRCWDSSVNEAVAAHYRLDLSIIAIPPSKFLEEQKDKREARKAAEKKAKIKVEKPAKKAARQTAEAKSA